MSTSTSTQIPNQKTKKKTTSAVNNTVNKLILDSRGCEKLPKKLGLPAQFININHFIEVSESLAPLYQLRILK